MVTPSFVMVGAPHFLSRTTLRPRGPSVTLTVFASLSMPASRDRRAASLNASCFAMVLSFQRQKPRAAGQREHGRQHGDPEELLDDDCQDVAGGQHEVLGAAGLDFGSAVLGVDDDVANGYVNGNAVAIFEAAGAYGDNFAFLRLLLCGVRDDQAGSRGLLGFERADNNTILKRLNRDRHSDLSFSSANSWTGKLSAVAGKPSSRCRQQPGWQLFMC
ncbi:hypothetical protein ARTHRO8AJ_140006 [Arthrobacter sp. 8AJ]|nr:hypothetical protein ARTHRO8AJ_140006 [Arthrobacter sp. 8AJ]